MVSSVGIKRLRSLRRQHLAISLLPVKSSAIWHRTLPSVLCVSHCGNDSEGGDSFEGGYGQAAGPGEVVAVGVGSALEQAEHAQPA